MRTLYKFHFDCGRSGDLYGLFIEEKEKVQALIDSGDEVYFGEVLGKYSDISGPIEACDLTMVSDDPEFIAKADELNISVGFNPFDFIQEMEENNE